MLDIGSVLNKKKKSKKSTTDNDNIYRFNVFLATISCTQRGLLNDAKNKRGSMYAINIVPLFWYLYFFIFGL